MLIDTDFDAFQNRFSCQEEFPRHSNKIISIEFNSDLSPVREVISRSNTGKTSGKWPSWKMGMSRYESTHERNAFKLLDAATEVVGYYAQPCVIKYVLDGVNHTHYPDLLVKFTDHNELWEVKTLKDSLASDVNRRSIFMSQLLSTFGYQYRVAIGEYLGKTPRLESVETVINLGRENISIQMREAIRQLFLLQPVIAWGAFDVHGSGPIKKRHISRLILEGILTCDLNAPINESTLISVKTDIQTEAA